MTTYTCDRCPTEAATTASTPPPGWFTGTFPAAIPPQERHVCETCMGDFLYPGEDMPAAVHRAGLELRLA